MSRYRQHRVAIREAPLDTGVQLPILLSGYKTATPIQPSNQTQPISQHLGSLAATTRPLVATSRRGLVPRACRSRHSQGGSRCFAVSGPDFQSQPHGTALSRCQTRVFDVPPTADQPSDAQSIRSHLAPDPPLARLQFFTLSCMPVSQRMHCHFSVSDDCPISICLRARRCTSVDQETRPLSPNLPPQIQLRNHFLTRQLDMRPKNQAGACNSPVVTDPGGLGVVGVRAGVWPIVCDPVIRQ
jgi:hypothetical protein